MLEKHIDALIERFLFKGNLQPELFSYAMRSECCDAYVTLQDAFIQDGQWIICSACRESIAFVTNQDLEIMDTGFTPKDTRSPFDDMREVMDSFVRACQKAARNMPRFVRLFSEEDVRDSLDELIIGDGTQMVDGKWKPRGFIGPATVTVDGEIIPGVTEVAWTQETPQSDED